MPNQLDANAGAVELYSLKGNEVALIWGRASVANSDANQTLTANDYKNKIIEITGTLTGTREVILPLTDSAIFIVNNKCSGGSLTFKGATGTGVTVAAGKTAWIYCDGTNYVQAGAALP